MISYKSTSLCGTLETKQTRHSQRISQAGKGQEVGSALFGFTNQQALVLYVPKKTELWSCFQPYTSDNGEVRKQKLAMILHYNATKAAFDKVDPFCPKLKQVMAPG